MKKYNYVGMFFLGKNKLVHFAYIPGALRHYAVHSASIKILIRSLPSCHYSIDTNDIQYLALFLYVCNQFNSTISNRNKTGLFSPCSQIRPALGVRFSSL